MYKITLKISGMMCGMCEAHICDVIRRAVPDAKKVKASRKTGEASFLCASAFEEEALSRAIADTGYTLVSVMAEQRK
ncbi:MAG: heavy-metal-associated domain-containing protein [Clostridia bacterium]|nr:heavy-metal-associated domain-containing protein [Clostridia bacterium]